MDWQRARTPEKVEERKQAILEAAKELFSKERYEDISFNSIAAKAGFTKSNVYRYFSSREEIFLLIYSELIADWSRSMVRYYQSLEKGVNIESFAQGLVKITTGHKQFLDLTPLIFTSLEQNSSPEQLLSFKELTSSVIAEHTTALQRLFPQMTFDDVYLFLRIFQAVASSFWATANPNQELKKIYRKPEFKIIKPDFEKELKTAVSVLLSGLLNKG
jgi:TetR/AcrR family transcriptional regulator